MKYINTFFNGELETIDEIDHNDYSTFKEYKLALKDLAYNHSVATKQFCWTSQKSTKQWGKGELKNVS